MLRNLRDTLLCLLLLVLLLLTVAVSLWLRIESKEVDSFLDHLNSATWNLSDAAWQADLALYDSRPILHATLIHADAAAGETQRTMQHVAHVTQDIALDQDKTTAATMEILSRTSHTLENVDDEVGRVGEQARFTLSEFESGGKSLRFTIDDFDKNVVNNPALGESFKNFALVTASFNDLLLSSNHFMQSSDKVVQRFVPKPYTGKHRVLHGVGSAAWGTVNLGVPVGDLYRSVRGYPH